MESLQQEGHDLYIVIKKKDVLEELLDQAHLTYENILPEGKKKGKWNLIKTQLQQIVRINRLCKQVKPDLLCGTSAAISIVGKWRGIPSYNFNEDDAEAVPLYATMAYPWATRIYAPTVCSVGKWKNKKVAYNSYHELAYLHPNHFVPDRKIAEKYVDLTKPYYLLRFASLSAHHDQGVRGISTNLAKQIISKLKQKGQVYITSEKPLHADLQTYQLQVKASEIHHVIAFSTLFIGDSQTMAAEAGVLGVPFIRFNDFVGRLSYLQELEEKYQLGFGFKTTQAAQLLKQVELYLTQNDLLEQAQKRRYEMLADKIDLSIFITQALLGFKK